MTPEASHNDKVLLCCQCNKPFTFTGGEQKFFAQRNLMWPKRCPQCREERRRHGTYGAQVVSVDSATDMVLCKRCQRPASRTASLKANEALCLACVNKDPDWPSTPNDDMLPYQEWKSAFKTAKLKGN